MSQTIHSELIHLNTDSQQIEGMLEMPHDPIGVILFAHGSGSSRFSPRNNHVAGVLRSAGMGTLLIDLLSAREDQNYQTRFDIPLLTRRLCAAIDWLHEYDATARVPLGLFGASTGAAAALQGAAVPAAQVAAIVARGGRPDMAGRSALERVRAPTLLIVGSLDRDVIELNQAAYALLRCEKRFDIVPGATHLFEEPGKLETVAMLATEWFAHYLTQPGKMASTNP